MALVAAVPATRVLLKQPVRREIRAHPTASAALLAAAVTALVLLLGVWPAARASLPILLGGAVALALLAHLRARPWYGRWWRLPPGSLGLATSLDAIAEKDFYARAARRWGPVFKMSQFHRPVACVVDLPLGLGILETQRDSLAQPRLPFGRLSPGNYIEFMDDARHARYRAILSTALNGAVIAQARPGVESVMRHELSEMAAANGGDSVDPERFLDRMAFASLLRVMFGVAADDARVQELGRLFAELGTSRVFAEGRPGEREQTFRQLTDTVRRLGEEMLGEHHDRESQRRSVLGEILRADPAHLDDETLVGNLVLIVHVTRSNVRGLLGWVLQEYCEHPQQAHELRTAAHGIPAAALSVEALATHFVNETLRLHQSEYFYREVLREIRIGPFAVPKGWLLRVCVRECHDDPEVFADPGTFAPQRFAARKYDRTEYCPFSDGTHSCFGAGLAVMIATTLVRTLATAFDLRKVADGPVERDGNRHWSHWRPSQALRLAIAERDERVTA